MCHTLLHPLLFLSCLIEYWSDNVDVYSFCFSVHRTLVSVAFESTFFWKFRTFSTITMTLLAHSNGHDDTKQRSRVAGTSNIYACCINLFSPREVKYRVRYRVLLLILYNNNHGKSSILVITHVFSCFLPTDTYPKNFCCQRYILSNTFNTNYLHSHLMKCTFVHMYLPIACILYNVYPQSSLSSL